MRTGTKRLLRRKPDVQVTRYGKPCRVDDLKLGVDVRVSTRHDDETTTIGIECAPRD